MSENLGSTQPNIKPKRRINARALLFNALGLIIILALAALGGYQSGLGIRNNNFTTNQSQRLAEQYQYALIDMQFSRYGNAEQRLQWIISQDPSFPGAQEKLTEVLVLQNAPTPTLTPSLTPTPNATGADQAFLAAQQLIAAQDWAGALGQLDQTRKLDPSYQVSQVDGMYYFALRNLGYNQIVKEGNLEGGIYQLTLAERFGPLDRDTNGLRNGARLYLIGASFWELDWAQAVNYFQQVSAGWPGLWDGTMTSAERYYIATMRYADELVTQGQFCDAVSYYDIAQSFGGLDDAAKTGYKTAYETCYPPTAIVTPTVSETPTLGGGGGPVETPTDTQPAPAVTDTSTPEPPTETPPTP